MTESPPVPPPERPDSEDRISLRVAVIATLGVLSGAVAGSLTWLAHGNVANAALVGLGTVAAAYVFFQRIIH
ncbi:hypothetical protein ACOQFV_15970 [Nocardiopsis changdeensis]|uniref:Uncharacterized protein n=1 Tax=Nocardiopsis changdeensis TaxID=2831969 RepID=A0ABX8BH51_9ACTN|nr:MULTISPECIES: hypothetical protein [Nocardiopsis]QUX21555.1 hypothetical protein KGD84_24595 [Nocardiopsis changdeensis]QYX37488.1 hypothetical protein K1J57_01965 [Nocardiopsis sp. MT53]